jgi:hypothetical protein
MSDPETVRPVLDLIVLDCPDAMELGRFYSELLGWPMEAGSDSKWATLTPPGGGVSPDNPDGRPTLAFQQIDDWMAPTWPGGAHPQQFHLDFSVVDSTRPSPRSWLWGRGATTISRPKTVAFVSTWIRLGTRSV